MLRKVILNTIILLSAVILSAPVPFAHADDTSSFTVNIPDGQGGYTPVVIQRSGNGYVGPQGEFYPTFPSVAYLETVYGATASNPPGSTDVASNEDVTDPPPALPEYVQPDPPGPGYIWTPGYWAYDNSMDDYYWVPGTWVLPPSEGMLWTPGYWYWVDGHYRFREGYWGEHIGFYGGVYYGHGYDGQGFSGGSWENGSFVSRKVNDSNTGHISSFNGGPGGTNAQPTADQKNFMKEKHVPQTNAQITHMGAAQNEPALRASTNHGKPTVAATVQPGQFKGKGAVAATKSGAFYNRQPKPKAVSHPQTSSKPKPKPPVQPNPDNGQNKNQQGSN